MSYVIATEHYYNDRASSKVHRSGWTPRISVPLAGVPSPMVSARLNALATWCKPEATPDTFSTILSYMHMLDSTPEDDVSSSGWSPRMIVEPRGYQTSWSPSSSPVVRAERAPAHLEKQEPQDAEFVSQASDEDMVLPQIIQWKPSDQIPVMPCPVQSRRFAPPSDSSSNGRGYAGSPASPWLIAGATKVLTPSTSEEEGSSQEEAFPASDISSCEGSPVIFETSPVGQLDGRAQRQMLTSTLIAQPKMDVLRHSLRQTEIGIPSLPVRSKRPVTSPASSLRSPSTASLSTAESGGSNVSSDELTSRAQALARGSGAWAMAYQASSGDRRDALRFLCMSGIVTKRELSDESLWDVPDEHIESHVTIATDMLASLPYEIWIRKPKEACRVFEDRYTMVYRSEDAVRAAVFPSLGIN